MSEAITIDTASYERVHGKKPSGRGYWRFKLCTDRVTEKDHIVARQDEQNYDAALKAARELAVRRRANCIVVLP
jgi:hypothetical protein